MSPRSGTHLRLGAVDVQYRDALSRYSIQTRRVGSAHGECWARPAAPFSDQPGETDAPSLAGGRCVRASPDRPHRSPPADTSVRPRRLPTPRPPQPGDAIRFPDRGRQRPECLSPLSGRPTASSTWLLVGADAGHGSLEPADGHDDPARGRHSPRGEPLCTALPRNPRERAAPPESANAFPCHCFPYPNLLNALWRDAVNRPSAYPYAGTDFVRGFKALEARIGQYLGAAPSTAPSSST